jgi:hypothetical protein
MEYNAIILMLPELNEDSSKHWLSKVIVGTS